MTEELLYTGIRITLKDGREEDFDPLEMDDVSYTEDEIILDANHEWRFSKKEVEKVEQYDLYETDDGFERRFKGENK